MFGASLLVAQGFVPFFNVIAARLHLTERLRAVSQDKNYSLGREKTQQLGHPIDG
jgi:hypothetical protein